MRLSHQHMSILALVITVVMWVIHTFFVRTYFSGLVFSPSLVLVGLPLLIFAIIGYPRTSSWPRVMNVGSGVIGVILICMGLFGVYAWLA